MSQYVSKALRDISSGKSFRETCEAFGLSQGQRLKELRRGRGYTGAQLGERLGVTTSAVYMYESDRKRPSYEVMLAYARIFDMSLDDLFY